MRKSPPQILEAGRIRQGLLASETGAMHGRFVVDAPFSRYKLQIMSSGEYHARKYFDGESEQAEQLKDLAAWEHVSVSVKGKKFCPTWDEMCFVKDLFWEKNECVIQFHPPDAVYVNLAVGCLHLWKPPYATPTPPIVTV